MHTPHAHSPTHTAHVHPSAHTPPRIPLRVRVTYAQLSMHTPPCTLHSSVHTRRRICLDSSTQTHRCALLPPVANALSQCPRCRCRTATPSQLELLFTDGLCELAYGEIEPLELQMRQTLNVLRGITAGARNVTVVRHATLARRFAVTEPVASQCPVAGMHNLRALHAPHPESTPRSPVRSRAPTWPGESSLECMIHAGA